MFKKAAGLAKDFTYPVVISRLMVSGDCVSAIGAITIINEDGWFLTANHILKHWEEQLGEKQKTEDQNKAIAALQSDKKLSANQKRKALKKISRPHSKQTVECSIWLGKDDWKIEEAGGVEPIIDLGFGKLKNFDPKTVSKYPVFKDPTKNFETGVSLCRLGFPFYKITPTFDAKKCAFKLPPGSIPIPRFLNDGILCRIAEIQIQGASPPPFPMHWIETTSPGLKGQSGGPIFDKKGSIWGIQCNTQPLPLDLNTNPPQFLNVGRGVSVETITGLLNSQKINFSLSNY